ncbi:MAG: glycosyltransferase family 2 protein [Patescibacteria group bacterium]|nr:glycosyltransferase family 2 protein [Patescibacteria group bacterium]
MNPELSILITSYKNSALLKLCIKSIQRSVKGIGYEIIVADSATEEDSYDVMRECFFDIKFLPNQTNVGFGKLVNSMLKIAKGKFYFIINADIIIKNNAVETLVRFLKENDDVGIVGPKLINFDNTVQQSCFKFYLPFTVLCRRTFLGRFPFAKKHLEKFLMKHEQETQDVIEADWIMGSAMMASKKAVDEVGLFDERFFMYFEDVDWCWRFWEKGYKVVYLSKVRVFHYHGQASASKNTLNSIFFNRYARIHIISGIKFFLKYYRKADPHIKGL